MVGYHSKISSWRKGPQDIRCSLSFSLPLYQVLRYFQDVLLVTVPRTTDHDKSSLPEGRFSAFHGNTASMPCLYQPQSETKLKTRDSSSPALELGHNWVHSRGMVEAGLLLCAFHCPSEGAEVVCHIFQNQSCSIQTLILRI